MFFKSTVPNYFIWIKYLSWIGYSNEILVINQWRNVTDIGCESNLPNCVTTGDEVIKQFRMKEVTFINIIISLTFTLLCYFKSNYDLNIGLMGVLYVSWRILAFLFLLLRSYRKK